MAYNGGHRVAGARMCLRLALRHGDVPSLRSVGMALVPTSVYRSRSRRGAAQVPAVWVNSVADCSAPTRHPKAGGTRLGARPVSGDGSGHASRVTHTPGTQSPVRFKENRRFIPHD